MKEQLMQVYAQGDLNAMNTNSTKAIYSILIG